MWYTYANKMDDLKELGKKLTSLIHKRLDNQKIDMTDQTGLGIEGIYFKPTECKWFISYCDGHKTPPDIIEYAIYQIAPEVNHLFDKKEFHPYIASGAEELPIEAPEHNGWIRIYLGE